MGPHCSRPYSSSSRHYTTLCFPADTLLICHPLPARCRCPSGVSIHREPRYYYVERGRHGVERFHDPFLYLDRVLGPESRDSAMLPWSDARTWSRRDYEKVCEVFDGWARSRGMIGEPSMTMSGDEYPRSTGDTYARSRAPPTRCERLHHEERLRRMEQLAGSYTRRYDQALGEMSDTLYGSPAEQNAERYKQRQFKLFQDMFKEVMGGNAFGVPMWNVIDPYRAGPAGGFGQQQRERRRRDYGGVGFEGGGFYGGRDEDRRGEFRGGRRGVGRRDGRVEEDYAWDDWRSGPRRDGGLYRRAIRWDDDDFYRGFEGG